MSRARAPGPQEKPHRNGAPWSGDGPRHGLRSSDLFVSLGLTVSAVLAVMLLPQGSWVRFALTLPMLFFVPGYLLLQATAATNEPPTPAARTRQALLSIGISPGIIGILALSTSLVPGAFQSGIIIAVVTLTCVLLAAGALYRRIGGPRVSATSSATANPTPDDAEQTL